MLLKTAMDWPSWINAVTVVTLAGITYWYAGTTYKTLQHLRMERDDRLKMARQPFTNIIDVAENLADVAQRLATAATWDRAFEDTRPRLMRLHDDSRDLIFDVRARSEGVYQTLLAIREELPTVADSAGRMVAVLRDGAGAEDVRGALRDHSNALRSKLAPARRAVANLW